MIRKSGFALDRAEIFVISVASRKAYPIDYQELFPHVKWMG
jgi:hypothetical protein